MEEKLRAEHEALIKENQKKEKDRRSDDSDSDSDKESPPPPPPKEVNQDIMGRQSHRKTNTNFNSAAAETTEEDMMAMMGFGGFGGSAKE